MAGDHGIMCPFFRRERRYEDKTRRKFYYCDFGRLEFPDKEARREMLFGVCCNTGPDGFRSCPIYRMSTNYYDRAMKGGESNE